MIGCGGRGQWIADLFQKHGGYTIAAVADYFPERADGAGDRFGVPANRRFSALSGYRGLLECPLDAVAIISPPYFHPEQAAAAVAAGKHVYLAKPVAVDVPGCQSVAASGRTATAAQQVFLVDFQTRADPYFREAIQRVHEGALGALAFGEATYHAGRLGKQGEDQSPEGRLRNWVFDQALSGDIIVEQNIHTLDVMSWIMQHPPVRAAGGCARKVRVDVGDCHDTFSAVFTYPDDVHMTFSSRQFNGYDSKPDGIRNRVFGTAGVLETAYGGRVLIRGDHFWTGGSSPGIYQDGAVENIAEFHRRVLERHCDNPTVAPSVQSNLTAILGRTAAFTGEAVTWQQLTASAEVMDGRLQNLKA